MKRMLWIIILAAALVSLGLAASRWNTESLNRTVEIVYDLPGLVEISELEEIPLEKVLRDLGGSGVETIAVQPESLVERLLKEEGLPRGLREELPEQAADLAHVLMAPVAFAAEDFELIRSVGLQAAPKLNTAPWDVEPVWLQGEPTLLILSGAREFPKRHLYSSEARLALVEFHTPGTAGLRDLTHRMVRLHAVSAAEMKVLPEERVLNRYLRAVRERNIRVLYVRPFLEGENSWERSLQFVGTLQARLQQAGFRVGKAQAFQARKPALIWGLFIAGGIWAGAVLYGQGAFPKLSRLIAAVGVLGWLGAVGLGLTSPILFQQSQALLAAVVFPCLALQLDPDLSPLKRYWFTAAISILGAVLIVGTLNGVEYMLKIEEFRGVKLMHILPVFLVMFSLIRPVGAWLNKEIQVKYLVWAGIAGLFGVLYVLRTGNFGLPVPAWEVKAREFLENLLRTRPRTKEFLVGHPALYLAFQSNQPHRSWWLPVAVVGQVSLVNTFTHIHTSLSVSLLRTIYGLILGCALGWAAAKVLGWGERWLRGDRSFRILRVR